MESPDSGMKNTIRYCRRGAVLAALALTLAACGDPGSGDGPPGETLYQRACATCHGADGSGRMPGFPPLQGSEWLALGPDAVALVVIHGLKGEIEVSGRTYRGYMPPMNQLDDGEVAAVLNYINLRWADWPEEVDAARIARLREHGAGQSIIDGRADLEARLDDLPKATDS